MKEKKLKILIVEDELISRTLLKEMLSNYGSCDDVDNGMDALELLQESFDSGEEFYDLICLDIMMPGMSGHQVLQALRKIEEAKQIQRADCPKVIMITALDDTKNILEAIMIGKCEAYLTKPVSQMVLERHLIDLCLIPDDGKDIVSSV